MTIETNREAVTGREAHGQQNRRPKARARSDCGREATSGGAGAVSTSTRLAAIVLAIAVSHTPTHADPPTRTFAGSLQLDYLAVPTEARARQFTLDGATVELSLKLTADLSKNISVSVKACFA